MAVVFEKRHYLTPVTDLITGLQDGLRTALHNLSSRLEKDRPPTSLANIADVLLTKNPISQERTPGIVPVLIRAITDLVNRYIEALKEVDRANLHIESLREENAQIKMRLAEHESTPSLNERKKQFIERRSRIKVKFGKLPPNEYCKGADPIAFLFEHYGEFIDPSLLPEGYKGVRGLDQTLYRDDLSSIDIRLVHALKYACSKADSQYDIDRLLPQKAVRTDKILHEGFGTDLDQVAAARALSSREHRDRVSPPKSFKNPRGSKRVVPSIGKKLPARAEPGI